MIDRSSRYASAARAVTKGPDGEDQHHIVPPILPHPEDHTPLQQHGVTDSDRPDTLAVRSYGQATGWWLIADANTAAHPDQLTREVGTRRVLPRPEGLG